MIRHLVERLTQKSGQLAVMQGVAYRDMVTGLPNRAALESYVECVQNIPGHPVYGVLCLDLDGFKPVNDSYGHAMGDALLHAVGQRLSTIVRDGDIAVRHGGDEFVLLLRLKAGESLSNVQSAAQRIITKLAEPIVLTGEVIKVGLALVAHCGARVILLRLSVRPTMRYTGPNGQVSPRQTSMTVSRPHPLLGMAI
ncbi:GGDEF domain-containing protein [Pseudomonas sp. NPDC090964]|uniref:diguanylate cyclase domain-containing protein n=1 Tax=Pseudomonas TaxID=286 RepID=UPI0013732CBB